MKRWRHVPAFAALSHAALAHAHPIGPPDAGIGDSLVHWFTSPDHLLTTIVIVALLVRFWWKRRHAR